MTSQKNEKISLSFRKVADSKLLEMFKNVEDGEVSRFARALMYDGLRYQEMFQDKADSTKYLKESFLLQQAPSKEVPETSNNNTVIQLDGKTLAELLENHVIQLSIKKG